MGITTWTLRSTATSQRNPLKFQRTVLRWPRKKRDH